VNRTTAILFFASNITTTADVAADRFTPIRRCSVLYVCMYVCMYVYMYVCMYVCIVCIMYVCNK
jgi:hypothetical protein